MKNILSFHDFQNQLDEKLVYLGYKKYSLLQTTEYCLQYNNVWLSESFYCFFRINFRNKWVEYVDNKEHNPLDKHSAIEKNELTFDNLEKLIKLAGDIIAQFKKDKIEKKIEEINKDFV